MKLTNVKAIARKEYYHLIRDVRSLFLAFFIPLFLIILFGYALSLDVNNIRTVVLDHDRTELSRDLIRQLDASEYFDVVGHPASERDVTAALDDGEAMLAVTIPPRWSRDMQADREAPIQVLFDGSNANSAAIARAYVTAFMEAYNRRALLNFINRQGAEAIKPAIDARTRIWFNEDLESRNLIVPGEIAIIIMIVGAMLTSLVIAREFENGTMETLLSLPLKGTELLIGKAIPYFLIGLINTLVAVLMAQGLFGIVMKSSFWLMLFASSLYLLVAIGLGFFISIGTKSQLVANQIAVLTTYLPSLLISDFVFPVEGMPKVLQWISSAVPATYYIRILKGVFMRGVGVDYLWGNLAVLAVMFLVLGALTVVLLRKEGM